MANQDQHDGNVRHSQPEAAAREPRNAAIQEQVNEHGDARRQEAVRARATTPTEVSEKAVAEIAEEAEARARP